MFAAYLMSPDRQWKPLCTHHPLHNNTKYSPQVEPRRVDSSAKRGGSDDAGRCETSGRRPQFNTLLLLFTRRHRELCFFTRSLRKSGLQNRVLEYFGGKLVVRKPNCPFWGEEAARAAKAWFRFSITNAIFFFIFTGTLHNCNPENDATAGKDIRTKIKKIL